MSVKYRLREKKITQVQFAKYCGVSIRTVCRYWDEPETASPKYFKLFADKILLEKECASGKVK